MSTQYYCGKCQQNHRYNSKIGQRHLKYKEAPPKTPEQGNEPLDTLETNLQEETEYVDETTEDTESHKNAIKLDQELFETNEPTENGDSEISAEIKIDEEIVENPTSNRIIRFIRDYQRSYQNGVEKFGIWWKVFQLSIWGIVLIFIIMACIIFVVYLPKIDMINWIMR